uniref:DUF4781 domain-containing protein n=1 Tax=Panagrolaimus sp. ES5 TaxID=591445 RepID=A0AC34F8F4_9BILA
MKFVTSRFRKRSRQRMEASGDIVQNEKPAKSDSDWWDEARQMQFNLRTSFCPADYDEYVINNIPQLDERELLTTKLCYLIYGQPKEEDTTNDSRYELQLEDEYEELIRDAEQESLAILSLYKPYQKKKAKELTEKILSLERKYPDKLHAAIIFVCLRLFDSKLEDKSLPIPVIRVLREPNNESSNDDTCWFVDLEGRAYKGWDNYLSSNKLPRGEICFPINGIYSTRPIEKDQNESTSLLLNRSTTPSCSLVKRILSVTDLAVTVATFGALAVAVAGLAITVTPVVAAVGTGVGATSMIYGGTRSVSVLVDRGRHKQTLAPKDAESRGAWIGLAGTALAVGSIQATQALSSAAASAEEVGRGMQYTANIINTSAIGINSLGILNHGYSIFTDWQEERPISKFDLMQLSLSALLLTHSLINFKTAKSIIREAQTETLADFEQKLDTKKSRKGYERVKTALGDIETDPFVRNKRMIRTIRQIDDPRDFFRKAYELTKQNNRDHGGKNTITFGQNGGLIIGDKELSAASLSKLNKAEQAALLNDLSSITEGNLAEAVVADKVQKWNNAYIDKDQKLEKVIDEIPLLQSKGAKISVMLLKRHLPAIGKILQNVGDPENLQRIMTIAVDICESMGFRSPQSLFEIIIIIRRFINVSSNNNRNQSDVLKIMAEPNSFLVNEIRQNIVDMYFEQVNATESNFAWKYSDRARARHDFENYKDMMQLIKKDPLSVRDYWQKLQEFFDQNEPKVKMELEGTGDHLTYDNSEYKGEVVVHRLPDDVSNHEVLYFHRKKP